MEIDHLKCFIEIENCMSFTTAADLLCMSQSSLSKKISALESELNVKLFDRSNNRVTLTPEGKKFSLYARKMLDYYNEMLNAMDDSPKTDTDIRVACIQNMELYQVDRMIREFEHKNQPVHVDICETYATSALELLKKSAVDLAILRRCSVPESIFTAYPLLNDELLFICSANHRFADRTSIDLAEAAAEHFFLLDN